MIPKLEVNGVSYSYHSLDGETLALDHISFDVSPGEFLAIVGPSGCGKSTLLSMLCGLTKPEGGTITIDGVPLTKSPSAIGYMLQKDHLFEWRNIFSNISLGLEIQKRLDEPARQELLEMMAAYGLAGFEYAKPSELSGGMRQRVMIAMALCCNPQLLICDEPTTALDVTIQAQILDLINELKEETGTSVMMITHDLGVIAEVADDVMVMYAGKVVEHATCDQIFDEPLHPYTAGLMNCIPRLDGDDTKELSVIEGMVPSFDDMPEGCAFCPRCPYAKEICRKQMPELEEVNGRRVRCFKYMKGWEESAK